MALSREQEAELWRRWRQGEPSRGIARTLRTSPHVVRAVLARHGGVRPAERRRSARHLTAGDREEISRGLATGLSAHSIAHRIGRSPSTVSREISRNGGRGSYRASPAESAAWERARRPKTSRLASNPALLSVVRAKLELDWSPGQISNWLKHRHGDPALRISHETIYRSVYLAARTELGPRPSRHLRSQRSVRQVRKTKQAHGRGVLRNMTPTQQRPAAVGDRVEVRHWEGDLVMGKRPTAVVTLVERATHYVRVVPLPEGYRADAVRRAITADLQHVPAALRKTLTWDRGREMAEHTQLAAGLGIQVYFCDPRSPWQRGSNENTNRLLRQYLAKGADLSTLSLRDLDDIAARINQRPRSVLDWSSAAELFAHARTRSAP